MSGVPQVGVDVLQVDELDPLLERHWLRSFLFSARERRTASRLGPGRRREFLAGRFAAKEAVLKVLRTGLFSGVAPRQIEIARQEAGAPEVRLAGPAAQRASDAGVDHIALSISHKDDLVVAVAVGGPATPSAGTVHEALDTAIDSTLARKDMPRGSEDDDRHVAGPDERRRRALRWRSRRRCPDAAALR